MSFKSFFLSLTVTAMLFYSVVGTTTVYADDGTGTEPTGTETPAPPPEEEQPTDTGTETDQPVDETADEEADQPVDEAAVEETDQPVDEAAVEETDQPVVDEAAVVEADQPVEEVTVETILEQLPEDTTLTVLDSEGEALPLASQETADAIESAYDPIWCPAGQDPTPGENGCTESYSSFDELLTFLQANEGDSAYQTAGTIYIQQDAYLGGESEIDFNDYNFTSLNNYDLTLQGGWDTTWVSTDETPFPDYTTTTFNVPIIIGSSSNPWVGSLTINNISISGVSNQTGLTLYSDSFIELNKVEVTNSRSGANLDAGGNVTVNDSKFNENKKGGATIRSGGDYVSINYSEFNNNGSNKTDGYGLKIESSGEVALRSMSASLNEIFGANVTAGGPVYIDQSVFSGNVSYSYNCGSKTAKGGYGLKVVSQGNITVNYGTVAGNGIEANDNYEFGAYLEGVNVSVGYSTFNNNGYGLKVISHATEGTSDAVSLQYVTANDNKLFGANISAELGVRISNSFFDGNKSYTYSCKGNSYSGYGLQVTTNGSIALASVSASENNLFGAHLEGANIGIGDSLFNYNGSGTSKSITGSGLEIISTDSVSLSSVEANYNQKFGANILAVNSVSIANGKFNGNTVYSKGSIAGGGYGLNVVTTGTISLSTVKANDNYLYGANLDGFTILLDDGYFENNGSGDESNAVGYGLKVVSDETVSISNIHANENQLFGTDVQAGGYVTITNGYFSGHQAYTFNPCTGATDYYGYGLTVVSTGGDIALENVTANVNNLWGASLDGLNINVSNSKFNNNVTQSVVFIDDTGLLINSRGSLVSLFNVEAKENRLIGADIKATGVVFINDSDFSDNQGVTCSDGSCNDATYHGYGLKVVTLGSIFVGNVTANNNNLFGAHFEGASVSITNSTFDYNGSDDSKNPTGKGLEVISTGGTSLTNVSASYNELFGADIQDDGNVTITASLFNGNKYYTYSCKGSSQGGGYGLKVVAQGDILLTSDENGVGNTANDNGAEGAILENDATITVIDSTFNNNGTTGLTITGNIVVLTNVTALDNGVDGAKICANDVTVTGSTFNDNGRYGLNVGAPVFSESGNTYLTNGSTGLFYNPSCATNTGGGNNNGGHGFPKPKGNWNHYTPKSGSGSVHGSSYHGGSCNKSAHSFGKKW